MVSSIRISTEFMLSRQAGVTEECNHRLRYVGGRTKGSAGHGAGQRGAQGMVLGMVLGRGAHAHHSCCSLGSSCTKSGAAKL